MKYIKKLNINFDNWDEIKPNNNVININKTLNKAFNELHVGDKILIDFIKNGINYKDKWGLIKYKGDEPSFVPMICVEFDDNIDGHDGNNGCNGRHGHCWYFLKNSILDIDTFIKIIIH